MKTWARIVAILGVLAIVLPIVGLIATRWDWVAFQIGFLCLALGLVSGSIAFFSALVGHVVVLAQGLGPLKDRTARVHFQLASGGLMGLAVAVLVVGLFLNALKYPAIYDVSTDVNNPPVFNAALKLRGAGTNPLAYNDGIAEIQQASYPDVKPLVHEKLSARNAYALAREVALELNWEIVAEDEANTLFEAVSTTFWYRFEDDIVVRVRRDEDNVGSVVDIRSASRYGVSDVGTNANRIREFLRRLSKKIEEAAGAGIDQ